MDSVELINVCHSALRNWHDQSLPASMNKRALAELLLVSECTLTEWQQKGMPVAHSAGRGASNEYAPALVNERDIAISFWGASRSKK